MNSKYEVDLLQHLKVCNHREETHLTFIPFFGSDTFRGGDIMVLRM